MPKHPRGKQAVSIVLTAFVILSLLAMPAAIGSVAAQEPTNSTTTDSNPTTTTATASDTTAEECDISNEAPDLRQSGLHIVDDTVTVDSPAEISGQFRLSAASECPINVAVTLSVPNGMYIEGGQNIEGSTSGLATGEFIVDEGDPKEVRATVYSTVKRDQVITADVEYWPKGHPDEVQTETYRLKVHVDEPNADEVPPQTASDDVVKTSEPGDPEDDEPGPLTMMHIGLIALGMVGLIAIAYKGTNAEIVNKFIKR